MGYEKILLSSIGESDPYKGAKELEIKRWCSAYWPLMESWGERKALFFQKVFSDKTCWEVTGDQVQLNRYTVGKKLLTFKAEDRQKNLLNPFYR